MLTKLSLLLLVTLSLTSAAKWKCPAEDLPDNPCYCVNRADMISVDHSIRCYGTSVTQKNIDDYVTLIASINNMLTVDPVPTFYLHDTNLTTLDLTVFDNSRFVRFQFHGNEALTETTGAVDLNLSVSETSFYNATPKALTGFFRITKVSQTLTNMYWMYSDLASHLGTPEMATALSFLVKLDSLQMHYNNIVDLTAGDFSGLKSLRRLLVGYNDMKSVGANALILPKTSAQKISVSFQGGLLNNDVISSLSGFANVDGATPVTMAFEFNEFEYISAENFEAFLNANEQNALSFRWNKIVCDSRMKWLKDGRERYESRVTFLECTNDEGKDIFTTDLV